MGSGKSNGTAHHGAAKFVVTFFIIGKAHEEGRERLDKEQQARENEAMDFPPAIMEPSSTVRGSLFLMERRVFECQRGVREGAQARRRKKNGQSTRNISHFLSLP
jgi:hypothetical protein